MGRRITKEEFIQDGWTEIVAIYEIGKAYSIINESMIKLSKVLHG